jgi:hypothetical protein
MKKILFIALHLALFLFPVQASAQEAPPQVQINEDVCGKITALVTGAEPGQTVRFQLGHDLVKTVEVSEQDTPVPFDSGPFPAGDWGFSVAVDGKNLGDQIVTVKPCDGQGMTLEVTQFDCASVQVHGTGFEQTNATVELAIPPAEGGESRDDLVAIKQVFPEADGTIDTSLAWKSPPRPGSYAVVALIDNQVQDVQSDGFQVGDCEQRETELPFTGPRTTGIVLLGAMTLILAGVVILLLFRRPRI